MPPQGNVNLDRKIEHLPSVTIFSKKDHLPPPPAGAQTLQKDTMQ